MIRVKDNGGLYIHQDDNWNVIGLTDNRIECLERLRTLGDNGSVPRKPPSWYRQVGGERLERSIAYLI